VNRTGGVGIVCGAEQEESPQEKARAAMQAKLRRLKWQLRTQKFVNEMFGTVYKRVCGTFAELPFLCRLPFLPSCPMP
jgi:hypothetical protein